MLVGVIANSVPDDGLTFTINISIPKAWEKLPPPKTFGDYIRLARMKKGWQVKELARKVKVTPGTVTNWEKDGLRPDYPVIRRLKGIFPELASLSAPVIYKDYPSNPMTFSQRLKQKRLDLNLSQRELAKWLCVCFDAVADWESGRTRSKDAQFEAALMQKLNSLSLKRRIE